VAATNGSAMKRKGSAFEREVVAYLQANGFPYAERAYGAGRPEDVGDIDGIPGWCIEAKAHRALDLAGFVDEAEIERLNGRRSFAAVVAKRRNRPTADSYVVLTLASFARLLADDELVPAREDLP
jgi:Holliday junction resolvase